MGGGVKWGVSKIEGDKQPFTPTLGRLCIFLVYLIIFLDLLIKTNDLFYLEFNKTQRPGLLKETITKTSYTATTVSFFLEAKILFYLNFMVEIEVIRKFLYYT